jgi:cyclic beta-1,2-glucan synthetase
MALNTHVEFATLEVERLPESSRETLRSDAAELAHNLAWLPDKRSNRDFADRGRVLSRALGSVLRKLESRPLHPPVSDDFHWLHDNVRLLEAELANVGETVKSLRKAAQVRTPSGAIVPRVVALAEGFLAATAWQFSEQGFTAYVEAFQEHTILPMADLVALSAVLKLVLLEQVAARGPRVLANPKESHGVGVCMSSLREVGQTSWKEVLEPLILFDQVLRRDPAGIYAEMDFESRDLYRNQVARIAKHSDFSEMEVANEAVALARKAQQRTFPDPRVAARQSHVGYYLLDEGRLLLDQRSGYKHPFGKRVQSFLRKHPDEFYLSTIEVITFGLILAILLPLVGSGRSLALLLFALLVLLLPASQSAIELVNYLATALLSPQILPKMDFSEGVPDGCVTLVAVPSLLLHEKQIRRLVEELEVRFLANRDLNIHFALLTDLPDSSEPASENDPRVSLCSELVSELNEKYAGEGIGSFLLLHRHRVYNPRERMWMGWERKRGKLLDLNKLLHNQYDSFPVKTGDLSILPRVRFVLTLDSDTELPRGSACRMIGAMAHPLNQAIIDPEKNIVVAGYGILQPRVGVSVQSAARSRLASIYSGETGLDIYTRAVSDVYQDLYGEGIFAGKGIYEVATLHKVLDQRFPRNALLSHDLIEGAYARAGLLSDVEVIEDYPSHYSAFNRRKHRWLRGDWQIAGWLSSWVPDESGHQVANPISIVSKWKILDNLRRSLVEPATVLLLVLGWLLLPGSAAYWTLATLIILFAPSWFRFLFALVRAVVGRKETIARDAMDALLTENVNVFFTLTFLPYQTLLSLDAVVRTLVRRTLTRRRLLQWETAAEAELGATRRTSLEAYLGWTPALALGLGLLVWFARREAFYVALPVLLFWAGSKLISQWLNRPPHALHGISESDRLFLRQAAVRTWRYFAEFCTEEHHWLIPDNVQEKPALVADRISPTNLGFLLNARQVACEFGYLTIPEFAEQTLRTLASASKLRSYRGQLFNWYDTRTLEPLPPRFISTVDSGNLMASLWTLQQGALERLRRPALEPCLGEGLLDHLRILRKLGAFPRRKFFRLRREMRKPGWLQCVLNLPDTLTDGADRKHKNPQRAADAAWFGAQVRVRLESIKRTARLYAPWLLPEFVSLRNDPALNLGPPLDGVTLGKLPDFIDALAVSLQSGIEADRHADLKPIYQRLLALLPEARLHAIGLIQDLRMAATGAGKLANEMDFRFLLNRRRKLLSVGYDAETEHLYPACYDLLATESRIAVFAAVAKDDIPQESWFLLGRAHTLYHGRPVLLSWTGTMFEYLMPSLWMHTYPNTLLERCRIAAVRSQRLYTLRKRVPWGISESAYFKLDETGNYQYRAFGIPYLALHQREENDDLIISPYSSFLALTVDAATSLQNLHRMKRQGWFGTYGFYEAADFTPSRRTSLFHRYELVRCWMTHHQGMSLLSIANFLLNGVVQRWFHADPRVQATELLLHEKPVSHARPVRTGYKKTLAG